METKWYHGVVWVTETSPNPGYTSLSGSMPTGKPHYAFADVVTKMTGEDSECNEEVLELLRAAPEVATQRDELLEALKLLERVYEKGDFESEFRPALERARSAIARATGASS